MRDPRARYQNTKPIEELIPDWAAGCAKCTNGVVSSPPLTRATDLHMERLVQMIDKELVLCDCRAGVSYYSNLRNRFRILFEEAKRRANEPHMAEAARRRTHPDIDIARQHIERQRSTAGRVPTIHWVDRRDVPVPPPADELESEAVA
jgi:hypothetical protein